MKKYSFTEEKQAVLEGLRQPFAIYQFVDRRVVAIALSDGFCRLFGYSDRARAYHDMDNDMYKDTHPDDRARVADAALRFAAEGGVYDTVYRTRRRDSADYVVVHAHGEHVLTDDGVLLAHVWYTDEGVYTEDAGATCFELRETLSSVLHEQSIIKANQYDYLTGLPSMTWFFELACVKKEQLAKNGGHSALLYLDFSGMKFFNSKHGFAAGDKMLQAFSRLLAEAFGNENCCRIGADHFTAIASETGLEDKLGGIFHAFGSLLDGGTLPVHVGIYPCRLEDVPVSTACDRAKLACESLKGSYHSGFAYYNAEPREDAVKKHYFIENFDTAVREKWIRVYLQPIIRAVNGRVCDVEALARWHDPEKGILYPVDFIPALEEAGLIYKLDLYMVDRILESIQQQKDEGIFVIPHSINLSRADFDACDIVEEIRKRVDAAGVDRDRITIEITESIIGSDFDFMKEQVERFRSLGFPVWMDDFGSGYSSLDVLQSIRFDLIKFDMNFMRKLDEGESGRTILTELMKLANALGVDTVCEGVETEHQVRFLQEIGCSKLQGYYYSKPTSFEAILDMYRHHTLIANENPDEADYYDCIGRVNLYDLGVVSGAEDNALQNTFETIPIAVLEVEHDSARFVRSNRSYRDFFKRFFGMDTRKEPLDFSDAAVGHASGFIAFVKQCCAGGGRAFFDERMPDGSVIHFFARRVGVNPVTGGAAVALAVLSVSEPDDSTTYADIARALAADYYNIYVIDLDTGAYIEYSSQVGGEELSIERHGEDFFESARRDALERIYEEDQESFLKWFTRENVLHELDTQGLFTITYRLVDSGKPVYVNMKITRMQGGNRIILGISIVDAQMKLEAEEKRLRQERASLGRIASLSPNYIVLYTVDLETGHYTQYNPSNDYESFGLDRQGEDFFGDAVRDAPKAIYPADMERHLRAVSKSYMLREIHENGFFIHNYRLMLNGKPVPVSLRATIVEEAGGEKLLLGVSKDDREIFRRKLEGAYEKARDNSAIYTGIALSLARGYTDLYYVNMDTDAFIEFHTDDESGVLSEARRGTDFFEGCERDAKYFVHSDDVETFVNAMNRSFLREALAETNVYELIYRRIKNGATFYVRMRITRMEDDGRFVVIAVSNIDEEMRQRLAEKRIEEERIIYARLHAITGNFICVYVVDPETGHYHEFSATDNYDESFAQAKEGTDFFATLREAAGVYAHPEDRGRVLACLTQENVMAEIDRSGIFTLGYRIMMDGRPLHIQLKAAMVTEAEGLRMIVGLNDIDAQVRQEEETDRRLEQAQLQANIDALTGAGNLHAFLAAEEQINLAISEHRQAPFAIAMLDVNDLKKINDSAGHLAGDQYLRDACKIVCGIFKYSRVFRVGGDEFVVIVQGEDYAHLNQLLTAVNRHNAKAALSGGVVIACGVAEFKNDACVAAVLERADQNMYENKSSLKADMAF